LALLVVGGAWVEGMYLTCHVTYAAYQFAGISKNLLEQKNSFELYLDLTKPYLSDPSLNDFVNKLKPVKAVYAGLTTSLTSTDIANITKAIEEVRNDIVLQ
jgi:dihydrodipicolinate reductase